MLLLARVGGLLRPRAFNWPQDSVEICSENLGLWDLCELVPTDNDNTPEFAFAAKTFSTPKVLPNYSTLDTTFFGPASGAEFSWSFHPACPAPMRPTPAIELLKFFKAST